MGLSFQPSLLWLPGGIYTSPVPGTEGRKGLRAVTLFGSWKQEEHSGLHPEGRLLQRIHYSKQTEGFLSGAVEVEYT